MGPEWPGATGNVHQNIDPVEGRKRSIAHGRHVDG